MIMINTHILLSIYSIGEEVLFNMEIFTYVLVAIGVIAFLIPLVFVWSIAICGVYICFKDKRVLNTGAQEVESLACSMDTDCPEGYVCINGHCIPAN